MLFKHVLFVIWHRWNKMEMTVLLGFVGILLLGMKKHYLFVCGECDLTFLSERDLRNHYAVQHIKKD